jgi:hypothetical protein
MKVEEMSLVNKSGARLRKLGGVGFLRVVSSS